MLDDASDSEETHVKHSKTEKENSIERESDRMTE
jgi:hypothetical protein